MKKFLEEFKAFALQGDVMSMAIGVIIGAAFKGIVDSFTESFITPILNCIGASGFGGQIPLGDTGNALMWGQFLSSVINFIIMAFVLFLIVKAANKMMSAGKKKEEAAPTTKKCPYCQSEIDIKATKCPHCTSDITE